MTDSILQAKEYFYKKEYQKALNIFVDINDYYSAGLCSLLLKREDDAQKYWKINYKSSCASLWGLCILDFINLRQPSYKPKFFQTRAFLEIYINLFIENSYIEWAQNLIGACDILYCSNPESYKFIARALYANGYFDLAVTFCKKTIRLFYSDPEAFLILSQCYYLLGNTNEALLCVDKVLDMTDSYFPAKLFREVLINEAKKKN